MKRVCYEYSKQPALYFERSSSGLMTVFDYGNKRGGFAPKKTNLKGAHN